jgi:hypothetical protein
MRQINVKKIKLQGLPVAERVNYDFIKASTLTDLLTFFCFFHSIYIIYIYLYIYKYTKICISQLSGFSIDDIKHNDYSLFVNKYNAVEEKKIEGMEYKKFIDICEFKTKSKRQVSYGKTTGEYPFYTSSKDLTKYCNVIDYKETCLIIGTGGNANVKISNNFSCSADNLVVTIKDSIMY